MYRKTVLSCRTRGALRKKRNKIKTKKKQNKFAPNGY